jgi:hypothetical protein
MRQGLIAIVSASLTLGVLGVGQAIPFFHQIDFDADGSFTDWEGVTEDYETICDDTVYTHDPTYPSGEPASIDSAILKILHADNRPGVWSVYSGGGIYIGDLSDSCMNGAHCDPLWVEDTFILSSDVLSEMDSNSFELDINLTRNFSLCVALGKSTLSGEYTPAEAPIPEASTLMLFGSGLSGLLLWARKRRLTKS